MVRASPSLLWLVAWLAGVWPVPAAETFRVATYNLQNYLEAPAGTRAAKPEAARAKIRESIHALRADVLALQEVGGTNALLELRAALKAGGWTIRTGSMSPHGTPTSTWRC